MNDIQFTPHFALQEFVVSKTARNHGIKNEPSPEHVENLRALCVHTLEPLREALGLPIIITSGYRCKALNELITHHSIRSQHMAGEAADFYVGNGSVSSFKSQVSGMQNLEHETGTSPMKHVISSHRERLIKAFRLILTSEKIDYDQLILYHNFIHVSFVSHESNRHCIMKSEGNGRYARISKEVALSII